MRKLRVVEMPYKNSDEINTGVALSPQIIRLAFQEQVDKKVSFLSWSGGEFKLFWARLDIKDKARLTLDEAVKKIFEETVTPPLLFLGGDHSITLPIVSSLAGSYGQDNLALVSFDAHPDTKLYYPGTDLSYPYVNAKWLGVLVSEGLIDPRKVWLIGCRQSELEEQKFIADRRINYLPMECIIFGDEYQIDGGHFSAEENIWRGLLDLKGHNPSLLLYMTIDIDSLDPSEAPGTRYKAPGGLRLTQLFGFLRAIRRAEIPVIGMDLTEINLSKEYERDHTLKIAMTIIGELAALFGREV